MAPSFNPQTDIPNLSGKVCLVTGGNTGIGEATLTLLAQHGPEKLFLAARSRSKAEEAIGRIRSASTSARGVNIEFVELDLASLESVKKAAAQVDASTNRLDYLHLNGGIAMTAYDVTKDGYETQFGVNYLSHALLTQLLMPKLLQTSKLPGADVRVVAMASVSHKVFAPKEGILFDKLKSTMSDKSSPALYGQAMLAKILLAKEAALKYPSITFSSIHPGSVKTGVWEGNKNVNWFVMNLMLRPNLMFTGVTPEQGAYSPLWCTFNKNVVNGGYYEPVGKGGQEGPLARDTKLSKKLWEWTSEELLSHGAIGWC